MSKASVIMATYNGERTVKESIGSILAQTHRDFELIVIDDGSTDNTVKIVKAVNDERVKLLTQKNSGSPAAPRNAGIKAAIGDFVAFCDQDDLWYPKKLEKQLQVCEHVEHVGDIGIVFSSADLINESGTQVDENIAGFAGFIPAAEARKKMLEGDYIVACSAMIPKRVMDAVGPLDETLVGVDDYDLWIRISLDYGVLAIPEKLCAWRQAAGSLSRDKAKQYIRTEQIFAKLGDKSHEIKIGHGKNMLRVIIASLLSSDYKTVREYLGKIRQYPLSFRSKLIVGVSSMSVLAGRWLVLLLQQIGKVSL